MNEPTRQFGTLKRLADGHTEGTLVHTYAGHGRNEVWKMLTDSASLAQWIAPGTVEPRVGGAVRIDFKDSGIVIDSKVTEFAPEQALAYSWSSGNEPQRPLRWALTPSASGTHLALTVGVPAGEDAAKACAGFEGHLEMLAAALEGVPIKFPFETYMKARTGYKAMLGG